MTGGGDGAGTRWSLRVARTLMIRPNALYWSGKPQINAAKHSTLTLYGGGNWPSSKPEHTLGLACATFSHIHLRPQMVLQASNEAKLHLGRIIGTIIRFGFGPVVIGEIVRPSIFGFLGKFLLFVKSTKG